MPNNPSKKRTGIPGSSPVELKEWHLIVGMVAAVFLCFQPTFQNGFVNWDDDRLFVNNLNYRGLSPAHLAWMFTTTLMGHYQPLTWLTLGLDYEFWGMNPKGYHITSLALHAINTVLFYFLIKKLLHRLPDFRPHSRAPAFKFACAAGALFFAVHPLRVESVAWVTERRDVLSAFFYLLTLIAYFRMIEFTGQKRKTWFRLTLIAFTLSLLSKAWGITLPFVLLVLDYYPLRRTGSGEKWLPACKRLVAEKIPFVLIALVFAVIAFFAAKKVAMDMVVDHGLLKRIVQAAYGLCFYPFKTLIPIHLSPLYLLSFSFNPMEAQYLLCAVLVLGLTTALVIWRRRYPWALVAWICYAAIVSPVLGLAQSGEQLVADRYSYISCLPFGILIGAGLFQLWMKTGEEGGSRQALKIAAVATGAVLLVLAAQTFRQTRVWRDGLTLWEHAVQIDPVNYVAYFNRARARENRGDRMGAFEDYDTTLRMNPKYVRAYNNRGLLRQDQKDAAGAIADYTTAINLDPKYERAYFNRAGLRHERSDWVGAIGDYTSFIHLNPKNPDAYANRAFSREKLGDWSGALQDFAMALKVAPENWVARPQIQQFITQVQARIK